MNKLKICRITSAFPPPWEGLGPGPYELSLAQAKSGHNLTVITKYTAGCEMLDKETPFKIYRIRAKRNLIFSLYGAIKFVFLNLRNRYDVVHNHGDSAIVLLLLKRLLFLKVPIITSVHIVRKAQDKILQIADIYEIPRNSLGKEAVDKLPLIKANRRSLLMEKLYIKLSDGLATVSEGLRKDIKNEYGISDDVFVVLNGVNIEKFNNGGRRVENIKIKHSGIYEYQILFVGVLNGRKGEFDLIKAMGKVVNKYPDIKLLVIGSGPTKIVAEKIIKASGIEDNIKFLSNVTYDEMQQYYTACDIFVLPSVSEGMPKVVLEVMSCGRSVIVSDIPGCRELVKNGENGFLVPTGRPDLLADAILTLYTNPNLIREMGRRSRKIVENEYTWDAVAQRIEECYFSVLRK